MNYIYIYLGIGLIIFATFRDGSQVNDYDNYIDMFSNYSTDETVELSFVMISNIVSHVLFGNIYFLFGIYAILGVSLKFVAIKRLTDFYFLSVLIYLAYFFCAHELTQIRAGVASGFLLLGIPFLHEKRWKPFFLTASLAFFFHYSAIIVYLLWFISPKTINKKLYLFLLPIAYLLFYLHLDIISLSRFIPIESIQTKVTLYSDLLDSNIITKNDINIFNSIQLLRIFFAYLILFKIDYIHQFNKYIYILNKIYIWGLASLVLLANVPPIAFRISDLLLIVEIVLIPNIVYIFRPNYIGKLLTIGFSCLLLFISLFYLKLIIV